ncbi:shufflon system plasmid conjugative transfer pilus tip adhesin PilV [Paraburkholderia sp. SARCC-3016]|uniref:shufflon system plasmid conjugative transfer pilus tip adhesin PilV n=1 Tax=Paraburkholderia sp. SARCC-3016 TaxID=3058611 RepID=UPI002807CA1B|nr:shufflon system plasmid conjugative transfer pilus tip adhesin PilV [Paraburkholderia sp. SARCC-3016]MDQ7980282.1 shufflon system plasmid conjugative transfer pilus tip adhesin PilV [Paraburkholderia sp. SARCC-3016]
MNSPRPPRTDARRGALPTARRLGGFTLVEMLATLAIAAMLIAGVTAMINSTLADARAQQAALYQSQLTAAATQLIQQNYTALAAQATASSPVVVKLNGKPFQLSTYLSSAISAVNAYGQTPCLLIYGTATPGALQALLVTEGGTTIPDTELGYAATNAGAGGGSIQATNNPGGAAVGAFGGWSVALPNPANAACSGTKTGVGHLASLIFFNGAQSQNADFLYRVGVPGDPAANTMQVPIVLAQQIDFAACTQSGSIAADAAGNVLNCGGGIWTPQASFHWREPVADAAALGSVTAVTGDVRMTLATNRAYTFNGKSWQALAVDEAGNLALGNAQTVGAACASAASDTTLVSTDSSGDVLSCRNGTWQTQSEIEPVFQLTGCQIIMAGPGAGDYPTCTPQPATNFANSPYSFNTTNGTFSYTFSQQVTLAKPGIIVVQSFAHLNDGLCGPRQGHEAQLSQDVDILDGNSNNVGHQESQTPTLTDDSGGINNSLTQAGAAGTYTVVVTTNWATFAVIGTPWTSSFCGEQEQTIPNSPVAAGWTINAYD